MVEIKDGYAPFCKHIFIENFINLQPTFHMISPENAKYLRTDYSARNEDELPVLNRWFELPKKEELQPNPAKYLDIILYSREQIELER